MRELVLRPILDSLVRFASAGVGLDLTIKSNPPEIKAMKYEPRTHAALMRTAKQFESVISSLDMPITLEATREVIACTEAALRS